MISNYISFLTSRAQVLCRRRLPDRTAWMSSLRFLVAMKTKEQSFRIWGTTFTTPGIVWWMYNWGKQQWHCSADRRISPSDLGVLWKVCAWAFSDGMSRDLELSVASGEMLGASVHPGGFLVPCLQIHLRGQKLQASDWATRALTRRMRWRRWKRNEKETKKDTDCTDDTVSAYRTQETHWKHVFRWFRWFSLDNDKAKRRVLMIWSHDTMALWHQTCLCISDMHVFLLYLLLIVGLVLGCSRYLFNPRCSRCVKEFESWPLGTAMHGYAGRWFPRRFGGAVPARSKWEPTPSFTSGT